MANSGSDPMKDGWAIYPPVTQLPDQTWVRKWWIQLERPCQIGVSEQRAELNGNWIRATMKQVGPATIEITTFSTIHPGALDVLRMTRSVFRHVQETTARFVFVNGFSIYKLFLLRDFDYPDVDVKLS